MKNRDSVNAAPKSGLLLNRPESIPRSFRHKVGPTCDPFVSASFSTHRMSWSPDVGAPPSETSP